MGRGSGSDAQIAANRQEPLREAFVMMHQAVDVLLDQAVTDEFKTQRAVALRSEALRLASLKSPLVEAAEETLRVLGPHKGAHEGEWYPCLARLRDVVGLVRRG